MTDKTNATDEGLISSVKNIATTLVVVLLAIFIIVLLWDTHRLLILGSLTGLFIITGILLYLRAARAFKSLPRLFESSIVELSKDQEQLNADNKE